MSGTREKGVQGAACLGKLFQIYFQSGKKFAKKIAPIMHLKGGKKTGKAHFARKKRNQSILNQTSDGSGKGGRHKSMGPGKGSMHFMQVSLGRRTTSWDRHILAHSFLRKKMKKQITKHRLPVAIYEMRRSGKWDGKGGNEKKGRQTHFYRGEPFGERVENVRKKKFCCFTGPVSHLKKESSR